MRYTKNSGGKMLVPKEMWPEAAEKLARYEDTEEMEDVKTYCNQLRRAADEKEKTEPDIASLLRMAADMIVNMNNFRNSAACELLMKAQKQKKEIFNYLDIIDGQITEEDWVSLIRDKLTEVLK